MMEIKNIYSTDNLEIIKAKNGEAKKAYNKLKKKVKK